jgi:hypothetical protein
MSTVEVKIWVKTEGTGRNKRHTHVCKPNPVPVNGPDRKLHWKVMSKGWCFDLLSQHQPLQILGRGRRQQFPNPPLFTADGKHAYLGDLNGDVKEFKYKVYLVHESGSRLVFDPKISNRNGA